MSDDEVLVTIVSLAFGPVAWGYWLIRLRSIAARQRKTGAIWTLTFTLIVCVALTLTVLRRLASLDVVVAPNYQFMYVAIGLAWLRGTELIFRYLGVSTRDDAIERHNQAAVAAIAGGFIAVTLCFVGGNIGNGPGWWVVLFSAGLSTSALLIAWAALASLTPIVDTVVIDRDTTAGIRLGCLLISLGLVFGRGVAGDWYSAAATIRDFTVVLPAATLILVLGIGIERVGRNTPDRPHSPVFTLGVLPSLTYLAIAVVAIMAMRGPE